MIDLCKLKCPKIPVVRKCCFCIPTYVGIAIFGYADLTLALVAFPMLVYEMVDELTSGRQREDIHYSDPAVHLPVIVAAALADILLTVLLLIGAHRKNKLILKIYFYFATFSQLMTLFADLPFVDYTEYKKSLIYIFFVFLNIYLLFLVHNVVYVREDSLEIQYRAYEPHRVSV
ncbi:uncharacterized protein LOC113503853 isoform X1 [Trichoplusia ni]|uniref:Uncharacterized protein LOC113503795 n=1 Tax=Trichoplusia ni TaxID=7111 RepID=A0A7E5WLX7_TRINI|nr:uncharacterized protein LOC113503795 [Trichoplusia ni]XP_026741765.1 uncharacterized protein LOC113503853 isoform X1 [Trichoplusia ni]